MKLNIRDEFSPLKKVAVCWGASVPQFEDYKTEDPQELRWGIVRWNKELLLKQQDDFFNRLSKYNVDLSFVDTDPALWWQMYTRDVAFVLGEKLYYSDKRTLLARNGEINKLLTSLKLESSQLKELEGKIEGGDVLCGSTAYVGISNRTMRLTFEDLSCDYPARSFFLGDNIMHLDCRMTLLPSGFALAYPESFNEQDWSYIKDKYKIITITKLEADTLAGNVFIVNPETIFVEKNQKRLQDQLIDAGFKLEIVEYTEPIILGGSFRCTTLPLERSY